MNRVSKLTGSCHERHDRQRWRGTSTTLMSSKIVATVTTPDPTQLFRD
jgi:hypothetical protein